jgi:putative transposase
MLGISKSGYYAWARRSPSKRHLSNIALGDKIEAFWRASDCTYGRVRIIGDLEKTGIRASNKRIARLMRERKIFGVTRRKAYKTTIRNPHALPAPDLVDRKFVADAPDQLWVADITYVPTWNGFLHLAVVLDVFSRRIVGWAMVMRPVFGTTS